LPAVEPGILPGGNGVLSEKALAIWGLRARGKMPPSMLRTCSTVNTYARKGGPFFVSGSGFAAAG